MGCVMPITGVHRVQAALGLIYICAGAAKLLGADIMVEAFGVTALGQSLRIAVGLLEVCGGLCLFIPRASIYAAVVLGCTILGIVGAAFGHMAHLDPDQPPFASQFTNSRHHDARNDNVTENLWHVPSALACHGGIEG
jgi:uncharacterized membrane protein YphA (DoxX/SURF4 family)